MYIFKIFQMLLMAVTWTNIEVDVPVYSSIDEYITIPEATLTENGNIVIDENMYYVYDGVDNNFRSDIETNYLGRIRYMIKAVFPTYHIESKQEIIFNVIDIDNPTILTVPTFTILLGEKIPDVKIGLDYKDNFYQKNELIVNVLSLDTANNKKVGRYPITYQVIDPSNNIETATSYIEVVDRIPPNIEKLKEVIVELGEEFNIRNFYKFTDDSGEYIDVILDDTNINYNKVGMYQFNIVAKDKSGNVTQHFDLLKIIYTKSPELVLFSNVLDIDVNDLDYETILKENIKHVSDKVDVLSIDNVFITHLININKLGKYQVEYKVKNSFNKEKTTIINVNILDRTKPNIEVLSDLIIPYGITNFIPQNHFKITDNYDEYSDLNISYNYKIDFKTLGDYSIRIEASDTSKNKAVFEGIIKVSDLEPPVFLVSEDVIEVKVFTIYNFSNILVTDNYDKNPTLNINSYEFRIIGQKEITLIASDSSGNQSKKVLVFNVVDDEAPIIILKTNEIKLSMGSKRINYIDYIEEVYDNYDFLEISDVKIIDTINYNELGIYELIYYLTDQSGNEECKIIEVKIDDTTKPIISLKDEVIPYKSKYNILSGVLITDNDPDLKIYVYPNYIDTSKLGVHQITYVAIDSRGNIQTKTRLIEVKDKNINIKTYLYIGINLVVTSCITGFSYLYFEKKKRK